jgi:hypothetical protein
MTRSPVLDKCFATLPRRFLEIFRQQQKDDLYDIRNKDEFQLANFKRVVCGSKCLCSFPIATRPCKLDLVLNLLHISLAAGKKGG